MWVLASPERKKELENQPAAQKEARERMALFPTAKGGHFGDGQGGARSEVIFVEKDKWVPVVRLGGKVRPPELHAGRLLILGSSAFSRAFRACSSSCCLA